MRKRVQSFISVLCALALLLGCVPMAMAESTDAAAVSVISVQWDDVGDQDGLRPAAVTAALYGGGKEYDKVTLNEENNWTGMLAAPVYAGETPVSYQWKLDGVAISGANSSTYVLKAADAGKVISCELTTVGDVVLQSKSSATVIPLPAPKWPR